MKTFLKSLCLLMFLAPLISFSQAKLLGSVQDEANGLPLPGVNILIKGTTTGSTTDFDGNYSIMVNEGDVLVFTYLGYSTKEITYNGQSPLNISLTEDAGQLDEIVLIGYGSTTKQDATGAVEKIGDDEFNKGAIVAPEQLLAGKAAGVRVTSNSGAPGEGAEIRIRGGASLSATNSPLIVVDGLPLDQRGVQGVRGQLNAINPNDIEDFVVLKDASATAIYGSRASNGVILITTKKGKANAPLKLEYDLKASVQQVNDFVDVLNTNDFIAIAETAENFNPSLLGNSSTNWQDEIYTTGVGAIHNITASKGYENFNFRVNYNHVSQQGVLKGGLYERNALNTSFVQRLLDNDLKLTLTAKGVIDEYNFADGGAIGSAIAFDPTQSPYTSNGQFFNYTGETLAPVNPLFLLENNQNKSRNKRVISNFNVDYKFWFLKELRFNMNAGIDYSENNGEQFNAATPTNPDAFAFTNFYNGLDRNTALDLYFNYKKDIKSLDSNIDLTVGHAYQEFYRRSAGEDTGNNGIFVDRLTAINRNALESYFARASFDIKDRYLLSLSYRRDGSSRFSDDNKWSSFPGASVGWKVSNEKFMENSFLSNLKLRAGWGITGQQEIGLNYAFLGLYSPGTGDASVQIGNQFLTTLRPEEFDENLKWEETTQYNVAVDFGLLNDRLTGTIDAYYKETEDLLATIPTPAGSNLSDLLLTNVGNTLSRGIEFSLNGKVAKSENFNWDLGFNVTFQDYEITKLNLNDDPNFFIPQGGISGGVGNNVQLWRPGYDPTTFFVFRQVYDNDGRPIEGAYVDVNGDNQITEADRQAYKKATPDAYAGFTSNMSYKNFDFSFTFRGSFGNYVYNNVASDRGNINTITGAPGNYYPNGHVSVLETGFQNQNLFSDLYIERADFVKLDNLSVGYLIPFEKISLRASFTATNVLTITKYDGLDPELANGIDNNFYPRPQQYVLGLNFTF